MKKEVKKTYGVRGLMAWTLHFPLNSKSRPHVEVNFEGGQITGYGVAPARFTTSDPLTQHLIETSKWFKSGKIFML